MNLQAYEFAYVPFFCLIITSSQVKYLMFFRLIIISSQVKYLMPFFWKNSFQIISPIRWQMGDEVWKPTDVQFYIFIYSRRVLFYPENILVDYVCRFGFNLWILDFIDFCETTSDRHFLFNSENKVLYGLIFLRRSLIILCNSILLLWVLVRLINIRGVIRGKTAKHLS